QREQHHQFEIAQIFFSHSGADDSGSRQSRLTKSWSDHASAAATNRNPASAARPVVKEPVRSTRLPITIGPTNPPDVPIELMNASPPASASPVRKRIGIVKKMPRAALMPASDSVRNAIDSQKLPVRIAPTRPTPPSAHESIRFTTLF